MKCKTENPGKGEFECLKEGRKVTRCARSVYVLPALNPVSTNSGTGSAVPGAINYGWGHLRGWEDYHADGCMSFLGTAH